MLIDKVAETSVDNVSAAPAQNPNRLCSRCGSRELQRRRPSLYHRIFSLTSYACGRCGSGEARFRFSAGTILPVFILMLIGGAIYLGISAKPAGTRDGSLNTADALDRARAGGLSTFEQMMLRKPRATMDNATILQLWRANVGVDVILQMIRTSNPDYDVGAVAVIELKKAGVDQRIILAMIDAPYNAR